MRDHILSEIKRIAVENDGQAPGARAFAIGTGIREAEWRGVYWARWGDALVAAGFAPNDWQARLDSVLILEQLALACRDFGRMPTRSELQLYRRDRPGAPNYKTIANHFGSKDETIDRLREWAANSADYSDVATLLGPRVGRPSPTLKARATGRAVDGSSI